MRFILACLSAFVAIVFIFSTNVEAYPKATDQAQRWQLDVEVGDLFFHRDQKSGQGYWALKYEVTNNTGVDRQWTPNFELATDRGEIISDGADVPRRVQQDVLDRYGDELLRAQSDVSGSLLLQGEANAIRGLVIWLAGSESELAQQDKGQWGIKGKEIKIFVAGVSGDTASVIHPITGVEHKLHRVIQLSWFITERFDRLGELSRHPVSSGLSVRRLQEGEKNAIGGDEISRKWIFR